MTDYLGMLCKVTVAVIALYFIAAFIWIAYIVWRIRRSR